MKKQDFYFIIFFILLFTPFFLFESVYAVYKNFNQEHGIVTSFVKFAVLATLGESLGLRIREGVYNKNGFGLLPRAFVWGLLGISLKIAFVVFDTGTREFLAFAGMENVTAVMQGGISAPKVLVAFSISTFLNVFYAPLLMTTHKVTDTHIVNNGGTIRGLFTRMPIASILKEIDWSSLWGFVIKKTIPLFWIPMQTITFLLPAEQRILFAALLSVVLGAILAFAGLKKT